MHDLKVASRPNVLCSWCLCVELNGYYIYVSYAFSSPHTHANNVSKLLGHHAVSPLIFMYRSQEYGSPY